MTLQVDFGNRRVEYPYHVGCDWPQVAEQQKWCSDTFKTGDWWYYNHLGAFYFRREKDEMLFRLRWA